MTQPKQRPHLVQVYLTSDELDTLDATVDYLNENAGCELFNKSNTLRYLIEHSKPAKIKE